MRNFRLHLILSLAAGLTLFGCDDDGGDDAGPGMVDSGPGDDDAGPGDDDAGPGNDAGGGVDAGPGNALCGDYCTAIMTNCTGDNQKYNDMAECVAYCNGAGWPDGTEGEMSGNTIECRIYHAGVASGDPGFHCPHASATGGEVCGTVNFRDDAPNTYTRVDRMGMPAVSTALISSAMKNAYNDADPSDDAALTFLTDLAGSNTGLHTALDDDLTAAGLSPCSMTELVGTLPECFGQEIAAGVTVASLVVPDTLSINPSAAAGFPNGRQLENPVMDVTLAIILLEMGASCGSGTCSPSTLVGLPLNPTANDIDSGSFPTEFPYLHPPHTL